MNAPSRRESGFTLLEMMIALSVLAISLTWLIEASARAVDAENHARFLTTATFLVRQGMVELEDELLDKGIQDDAFASEKDVAFEEEAFKRYKCKRVVDKVELPDTSTLQTALGGLMGGMGGSNNNSSSSSSTPSVPGMGAMANMPGAANSANMLTNQFGMVKDVLEQGIRRATVRCEWMEHGDVKFVEVSQYLTDPRRVDQAIQLPSLPGIGGGGGGGNHACPNGQVWNPVTQRCQ